MIRAITLATTLVGAAITGAVISTPAHAATTCVEIGRTAKSGTTISGYGSISCGTSSSVATVTIQRGRWYGWEDMKSATVHGAGHDQYVYYNCAGTGTHDFRTIISATTVGGSTVVKASNTITASC